MRAALRKQVPIEQTPDHVGLAYDAWAPIPLDGDGKVEDHERRPWLDRIAQIAVPADYAPAYGQWLLSFEGDPTARLLEVEVGSRLLVGHGNPSPTEVGLTVHHTWGVPILPGSSLKGVLAHWSETTFGPEQRDRSAWRDHPDPARARFLGPGWSRSRIAFGPGEVHRVLFGAPPADDDPERQAREPGEDGDAPLLPERGETRGAVMFHDAWFVPGSVQQPYAPDVLTVHQKSYYDRRGRGAWPNDHDSPNPVSFLSVRPGARFALVVTGEDERWTDLGIELLERALAEWGIGAKTTSGYGRTRGAGRRIDVGSYRAELARAAEEEAKRHAQAQAAAQSVAAKQAAEDEPTILELTAWLAREGKRMTHGERLDALVAQWTARLDGLPAPLRAEAHRRILAEFPKVRRPDVRAKLGGS